MGVPLLIDDSGATSTVYQAEYEDGTHYAVKSIERRRLSAYATASNALVLKSIALVLN